jgi:hypothetical protein
MSSASQIFLLLWQKAGDASRLVCVDDGTARLFSPPSEALKAEQRDTMNLIPPAIADTFT